MYNPAINEAEWIPMRGLASDLSWGEERSMVALANYVPHVQEGRRIARLGVSGESVMEESEGLAFDDPSSGSDTTVTGVDSLLVPPILST